MDWLQEYDFSDEEIRSVVAGMQEMSAVDGDVDPQELELIQQVAEGVEGDIFSRSLGIHNTRIKAAVLESSYVCSDC